MQACPAFHVAFESRVLADRQAGFELADGGLLIVVDEEQGGRRQGSRRLGEVDRGLDPVYRRNLIA